MQFKEGLGWKACYDEERNLYTAERSWRGYYQLCEIDKATYDALGAEPIDGERDVKLIASGRCLFEANDHYYTSPYCIVKDDIHLLDNISFFMFFFFVILSKLANCWQL